MRRNYNAFIYLVPYRTGNPFKRDGLKRPLAKIAAMMPPRQPLNVVKLSDHGGQYQIQIKCGHCGHSREARPETFARLASWETPLASILDRLRCSKCGKRGATATVWRQTKRDG